MSLPVRPSARTPRVTVTLAALLLTLALVVCTRPENTGDSVDWARDVAAAPSLMTPSLFEPGHLLWRPAGVLWRDVLGRAASRDPAAVRDAQRRFSVAAILGAALVTVSIGLLVLGTVGSLAAALLAVTMTGLGAAIVNFGQAGSPYVPGIAFVSLALCVGTLHRRPMALGWAALSGGMLAAGVLVWLPYVLVVPAGLLAIYLFAPGDQAFRWRVVVTATATCAVIGIAAYLGAAVAQGIDSLPAFVRWIGESSHGIMRPGLARVIIGLPRSFVHMGTDGREIRRYLLGDPLNPVSAAQVVALPVWPKLLLFYAVLASVAWYALRRPKGRGLLLVFVMALVPVAGLGAAWSGGEEERYLSLFPFLLPLMIWAGWSARREHHRALPVAVGAFALLWLSNMWAFNPWVARARSARAEAFLGCMASTLDARSVIIVPEQGDPLVSFTRDRLDELPRSVGASVIYLLPPRAKQRLPWDGILASVVTTTLGAGGRVWVPAYTLDSIPPRAIGWVEGAQTVTWSQVRKGFGALELRRACDATALLEVVALHPHP